MELQLSHKKILEYLEKHGSTNTFKLSRVLKINRAKLINLIEGLTKKGLIEFKHGLVIKNLQEKPSKNKVETPKKFKIKKREIKKQKEAERDVLLKQKEESIKKREEAVSAEQRKLERDKALLDKERENIVQKIIEAIGLEKEKEKIKKARKKLRQEKEEISESKALKEDINKLKTTLEDLKKKVSTEERRLKKLKEKKIKPKVISREVKKPKKKGIKQDLKPKIEEPIEKIGISKIETEKPELMPEGLLQPVTRIGEENIEGRFHDLIEQEISLLKQKKIDEARSIHLKIKDMISEVSDTDQIKRIIKDWNRIKEVY